MARVDLLTYHDDEDAVLVLMQLWAPARLMHFAWTSHRPWHRVKLPTVDDAAQLGKRWR